jgi:hypothetical protein
MKLGDAAGLSKRRSKRRGRRMRRSPSWPNPKSTLRRWKLARRKKRLRDAESRRG